MRYKKGKCEVEGLNEETTNAYSLPKKKKKSIAKSATKAPKTAAKGTFDL